MKRGYYIVPYVNTKDKGIQKKIDYQIQLFRRYTNIEQMVIPCNYIMTSILSRLPFGSAKYDYQTVLNKIEDPDYVYIRQGSIDKQFIYFLKCIKRMYPTCTIIYEIPAYPYDQVIKSKLYNYFIIKKDREYRKELINFIDRIVTYSKDDYIFGIKTIKAHNGIDCNEILPVDNYKLQNKAINLIAVATMNPWHGYERLFYGMYKYYLRNGIVKINVIIVGSGHELPIYEQLVKELHLEEYVRFTGVKIGKDLYELYNQADMAVASLGMYKFDFDYVSTLKSCEYLAKGLPIIAAYDDYVFHGNQYCLKFPNDSSDISVDKIIEFYKDIYKFGKEYVVKRIREIALDKANINNSYKDVVSYIMEH